MLEERHWFRALMEESLAVMSVDNDQSRDSRGPWGLLKLHERTPKIGQLDFGPLVHLVACAVRFRYHAPLYSQWQVQNQISHS